MKKRAKKLVLAKETVGSLDSLGNARGGDYIWTGGENSCKYCDPQPMSDWSCFSVCA